MVMAGPRPISDVLSSRLVKQLPTPKLPSPYNPAAYVPGGSSPAVSAAIQARGNHGAVGGAPDVLTIPTGTSTTTSTTDPKDTSGSGGSTPSKTAPSKTTTSASAAYDLSTDPIVQKIKALNTSNYNSAVDSAQAAAKQDIIGSGFNFADMLKDDPALAGSDIAGALTDEGTNLAAQQNPFSIAAQLRDAHAKANQGIDQGANDANLYYSSTRGNQLADELKGYVGNVSGAQNTLRGQLDALLGGLTGEKQTESTNLANAIEQARQNAITNAISSGQSFIGYDANGNPIFKTTTTSDGGGDGSGGDGSGGKPTPTTITIPPKAPGGQPTTFTTGPISEALKQILQTPEVMATLPGLLAAPGADRLAALRGRSTYA